MQLKIGELFAGAIVLVLLLSFAASIYPDIRDSAANISESHLNESGGNSAGAALPLAGIFSGTGALIIALMGGLAYVIYKAVWKA
jgi:hypothetical protein